MSEVDGAPVANIDESDISALLVQLREGNEESRMKALLVLRDLRSLDPETSTQLEQVAAHDESRTVRMLAREVLRKGAPSPVVAATMTSTSKPSDLAQVGPAGNWLQSLIEVSSAGTGIIATALSMANYYMLGRFPFPEPIEVLFWLNLLLTFPYIVIAGLLAFPGRLQRQIAVGYGLFSIAGCIAAMMGLRPLFVQYWSFQFTNAMANLYYNFLAPFQVGIMLMPVLLGQTMIIFFAQRDLIRWQAAQKPRESVAP